MQDTAYRLHGAARCDGRCLSGWQMEPFRLEPTIMKVSPRWMQPYDDDHGRGS
jgi:hypothetical protein